MKNPVFVLGKNPLKTGHVISLPHSELNDVTVTANEMFGASRDPKVGKLEDERSDVRGSRM